MSTEYYNLTPGPQYDVKDKPDQIKVPEYSFGFRRGEAVRNKVCTPDAVGPGRYLVENASEKTSNRKRMPAYMLPKAPKPEPAIKRYDKYQTYDTRSSLGPQSASKRRTSSSSSFGSSCRDSAKKLGSFTDQMRGAISVKLFHPKLF